MTLDDSSDELGRRHALGSRQQASHTETTRHGVVDVVGLLVLFAVRHNVNVVLLEELLGEAVAWCVGHDFGDILARCHGVAALLGGHDRSALVGRGFLVADDADDETRAELERVLEGLLVAEVAEIVDAVAVDVDDGREHGQVHVERNLGEERHKVHGHDRQRDKVAEQRCHGEDHDPRMQIAVGHLSDDHVAVSRTRSKPPSAKHARKHAPRVSIRRTW